MSITVIDTCCLINLYASGRLQAMVRASTQQALIPELVLAETLYIRQPCEDDPGQLAPAQIDLGPLLDSGIIEVSEFTGDAELERFVQLAGLIDDGEAACLAISSVRGASLATDDRRTIQIATKLNVPIVTTPELVRTWTESASPEPLEMAEVIQCIERYGRFTPHRSSQYAKRWAQHSKTAEQ